MWKAAGAPGDPGQAVQESGAELEEKIKQTMLPDQRQPTAVSPGSDSKKAATKALLKLGLKQKGNSNKVIAGATFTERRRLAKLLRSIPAVWSIRSEQRNRRNEVDGKLRQKDYAAALDDGARPPVSCSGRRSKVPNGPAFTKSSGPSRRNGCQAVLQSPQPRHSGPNSRKISKGDS
jgi:hypothetical protein